MAHIETIGFSGPWDFGLWMHLNDENPELPIPDPLKIVDVRSTTLALHDRMAWIISRLHISRDLMTFLLDRSIS
jgi:hypothetical protein